MRETLAQVPPHTLGHVPARGSTPRAVTLPSLTPHQQDAVTWVVTQIRAGVPIVAIRGLAGTGKSTCLPAIRAALEATGRLVSLGAMTHKAAVILRQKGLPDAQTLHSLAFTMHFTPAYASAARWLGGTVATDPADDTEAWCAPGEVPELIVEHLKASGEQRTPWDLYALQGHYAATTILASIGVQGSDHIAGFGPRHDRAGVCIVDEASMLGEAALPMAQESFAQLVLLGDSGQLGPVGDVAVLDRVPGVELTQIHRQAEGSPIRQLAYRVREGHLLWQEPLADYAPAVSALERVSAQVFLDAPLLVWRHKIREACTRLIRKALGYPTDALVPGEPVLCRNRDPWMRQRGFFNNRFLRVARVSPHNTREVTLRDDDTGEELPALVHLEELHGHRQALDHISFWFAYCVVVHQSQGSEWPTVYLSRHDTRANWKRHHSERDVGEHHRWCYTAVTRAQERFVLLNDHTFLP